jgi:hypothetical protein
VIVLLIILVVAAVGGMAAYVIMQYSGVGSASSSPGGTPYLSGRGDTRRDSVLSERIADASPGCLIAVLVTVGMWLTLWAILLILGLRVLTA